MIGLSASPQNRSTLKFKRISSSRRNISLERSLTFRTPMSAATQIKIVPVGSLSRIYLHPLAVSQNVDSIPRHDGTVFYFTTQIYQYIMARV